MANDESVFLSLLDRIKRGRVDRPLPQEKTVLTGSRPNPSSTPIQQKQQDFLDIQSQKIAQDIYSRTVYYSADRIGSYNDYRAMDMSPEVSAALDIITDECLDAETEILLVSDEKSLTIEELYERGDKNFSVYSYNLESKKIETAICERVAYKGEQDVYKITFDDESYVMATSEHLWLVNEGDIENDYYSTSKLYKGQLITACYFLLSEEEIELKSENLSRSEFRSFHPSVKSHRINSIKFVGKRKTYDLVNVGKHHNFAILTSNATGIFTHNCVTRDERGDILSIYSENNRIKTILKDLFKNRLNIEYNLTFWIREMVKFGDCFIKLEVDQKEGIYDVRMLPVAEIHREEAFDGNINSSRFKWDINNMYFEEFQVAHFRLVSDGTKIPYGRSILDPARKLWKQLQLAEDAMLVYRIIRAPERRVHYIEVGNLESADVLQYIEKVKAQVKKSPIVDQRNGQMNLKFNPLPVWKETPIPLLDGRTITIEELAKEFEDGKENFVFSVQDKTHKIVSGKVVWCGKNYTAQKLTKVWLDDNTWVLTAPEHPFVLRDGSYVFAESLKEGDSLMPFYEGEKKVYGKSNYKTVYNPNSQKYEFVHRLMSEEIVKDCELYNTVHHKDFNKFNNRPDNLEWVDFYEHKKMHSDLAKKMWENDEYKEKMRKIASESQKNRWKDDNYRKKQIENISNSLKKQWENKERDVSVVKKTIITYNKSESKRKKVSLLNKKRNSISAMSWYNNSSLHKEHNVIRSESLSKRWSGEESSKKLKNSMRIKTNLECFNIMIYTISNLDNYINFDDFTKKLSKTNLINELYKENSNTKRDLNKFFHRHNILKILKENNINSYREFIKMYNPNLISNASEYKNHKVLRVEDVYVDGEDVYCMTVVGLNREDDRHNFALYSFDKEGKVSNSGVFVRNTMEEDYFVPIRGDKSSRIETLPGACLALDTKIELLDGRSLQLNEIIEEYNNGKKLWAYSINPNTGEVVPGPITWAGVTRKNTDVVKITLDNGETITTTPDHKFPTKFNGIKEAKDLQPGESMWAFNKKFSKIFKNKKNAKSYEMVYDHRENDWVYTHRLVANYFKNLNLHNTHVFDEKFKDLEKNTIHHYDFSHKNNSPNNLYFMNFHDHVMLHQSFSKNYKKERKEGLRKYFKNLSEEELELKREIAKVNFKKGSDKLQELLKDSTYKKEFYEKTSKSLKISKNTKEYKQKQSEIAKKQWQDESFRNTVIEKQKIKYSNEMLQFVVNKFKEGKNAKQILTEINSDQSFFMSNFFELNKDNKQIKKMSNGFTHNNLYKMMKEFGYKNWADFKEKAEMFNHKIVSVELLSEKQDTGTITIDGQELYHNFHNFALSVGIFTQNSNLGEIQDVEYLQNKLFAALKVPKTYLNYAESLPGGSTLSQADLRFSRTINRIQENIVIEIRRIANIHLFLLGFEDDMDNFDLKLTNPSTQQELLKLETMKARLEVFKEMFTGEATSPVSYTWAMEYIMGFSKTEIKQILRQKKVEKKMFSEIETAPEQYMDTGLFADIDNKFKLSTNTQSPEGGGGAVDDVGGGGDSGDGGFGLGGDEAGEEDLGGGEETIAENVLFEEVNENYQKQNITESLVDKNKILNTKTKRLVDSITERLDKINKETGLGENGDDTLNGGLKL